MIPWERDIYTTLLKQYIEEQNLKNQQDKVLWSMDEEEYQEEEQSDSKINLGRFFERMDSVEKVASNALSKANANFGIIENQKALINSLNVSIEAIETKVRDIANLYNHRRKNYKRWGSR